MACTVYNIALKTFNMSEILFGGVLSGGQKRRIYVYTHAFEGTPRGRHCPKHSMKCAVCFQPLFVCFQSRFSSLAVELLGKFAEKSSSGAFDKCFKRATENNGLFHTL